eukprot:TRINITY_DN17843_c0_g2_i1.p1 TRINITY_DN17843_c0_g2~~TRINITY_DN17843_c0_g2_i1.p1  ORF type:complete len:257 (+),score=56.55 TRINITY_DN17843_c0_g2_i1:355-1125(+)
MNSFLQMICVSPDGQFIDSFGLFFCDGKNNDQGVLDYLYETNDDLANYFKDEDEFMVDRGFSRCEVGHKLHCPKSLQKGQKRLDANDADYTRRVTKFRYVIEAAFGRLKQFKFLSGVIPLIYAPKLHEIIRAAMTLINLFMGALSEDSLIVKDEVDRMIRHECTANSLENLMEETTGWKEIRSEDIGIPRDLSLSQIREWALGPYALNLADSYLNHSRFSLRFHSHENHSAVRVMGIPSRFTTASNHRVCSSLEKK